jgi:flagella basal body P-ring formation protein FlgA
VAPPQGLPSGGQLAADTALPTREVNLAQLPPRDAAGGTASLALDEPMRLRRAVQPGGLLTPSHLEPLPAVARGDWAVLQTGSGAVVLESRVQVGQDARIGQAIRVKPAHSPSFVWARVKGPHLLELVQ